jgi:hypothetical protein
LTRAVGGAKPEKPDKIYTLSFIWIAAVSVSNPTATERRRHPAIPQGLQEAFQSALVSAYSGRIRHGVRVIAH